MNIFRVKYLKNLNFNLVSPLIPVLIQMVEFKIEGCIEANATQTRFVLLCETVIGD